MIFGKKSDVKKHLSSKHSTFSHRLFVEDAPNQITGQMHPEEQTTVQPPRHQVGKPEDAPTKA